MANFIFWAVFKPENIECAKQIHKQIICLKTAVQTFLKGLRNHDGKLFSCAPQK